MNNSFLEEVLTTISETKKSILHLYSARQITPAQKMKAKKRGVSVEVVKREKGWFDVNFIY